MTNDNENFDLFIPNSPLVFDVHKPKLENLLAHALVGHGRESSAAENKVCLVVAIEIS